MLAWSAGSLFALGLAARHPERVTAAVAACGLPPVDAYDDPAVRAAAGDARQAFLDTVAEVGPAEAAAMVGPMLVPDPCDLVAAQQHLDATRDPITAREVESVPGASDRLAQALVEAVRNGVGGVVKDVELQATVPDVDFTAIRCPVRLVYGADDPVDQAAAKL